MPSTIRLHRVLRAPPERVLARQGLDPDGELVHPHDLHDEPREAAAPEGFGPGKLLTGAVQDLLNCLGMGGLERGSDYG